jgi:hypothetical protein
MKRAKILLIIKCCGVKKLSYLRMCCRSNLRYSKIANR